MAESPTAPEMDLCSQGARPASPDARGFLRRLSPATPSRNSLSSAAHGRSSSSIVRAKRAASLPCGRLAGRKLGLHRSSPWPCRGRASPGSRRVAGSNFLLACSRFSSARALLPVFRRHVLRLVRVRAGGRAGVAPLHCELPPGRSASSESGAARARRLSRPSPATCGKSFARDRLHEPRCRTSFLASRSNAGSHRSSPRPCRGRAAPGRRHAANIAVLAPLASSTSTGADRLYRPVGDAAPAGKTDAWTACRSRSSPSATSNHGRRTPSKSTPRGGATCFEASTVHAQGHGACLNRRWLSAMTRSFS